MHTKFCSGNLKGRDNSEELTFFNRILYAFLIYPVRATCPAHVILLDMITLILSGEAYRSSWKDFLRILNLILKPRPMNLLMSWNRPIRSRRPVKSHHDVSHPRGYSYLKIGLTATSHLIHYS